MFFAKSFGSSLIFSNFVLRNTYNFTVETFAVDGPNKAAYASVTVKAWSVWSAKRRQGSPNVAMLPAFLASRFAALRCLLTWPQRHQRHQHLSQRHQKSSLKQMTESIRKLFCCIMLQCVAVL